MLPTPSVFIPTGRKPLVSHDYEPLFLEKYNACKTEDDMETLLSEFPKILNRTRLMHQVWKIRKKFKEEARMSEDGNTILRKTGTFNLRKLLYNERRYRHRKNGEIGLLEIKKAAKEEPVRYVHCGFVCMEYFIRTSPKINLLLRT